MDSTIFAVLLGAIIASIGAFTSQFFDSRRRRREREQLWVEKEYEVRRKLYVDFLGAIEDHNTDAFQLLHADDLPHERIALKSIYSTNSPFASSAKLGAEIRLTCPNHVAVLAAQMIDAQSSYVVKITPSHVPKLEGKMFDDVRNRFITAATDDLVSIRTSRTWVAAFAREWDALQQATR